MADNMYEKQIKLLKKAETIAQREGASFGDALESVGLSYNSLVYKNSKTKRYKTSHPAQLTEIKKLGSCPSFVSFFSGCGGIDLGLESVGYKHTAAFEINAVFCKTLRKNRPDWKVFGPPTYHGDVSKFSDIANTLKSLIKAPYEGVFVGGPPCQPFSIAANQRFAKYGKNFKRTGFSNRSTGNLMFDFIKLILEFKPRAFLIENVPGLRDLDDGKQLTKAIKILEANDYHIESPFILNAADFNVPQHRNRLFIIGSRLSGPFKHLSPSDKRISAGNALKKIKKGASNNEIREHKIPSVIRYSQLDYGKRDTLGRVDRLDPSVPSKTIIAGGNNGGGRSHLHPEIPRTLSVRECARLQTFPDDYVFVGSTARQFTQVGNAIPPVLAAQIGVAMRNSFF